jgi:diacylglycerol O-acyltransferase
MQRMTGIDASFLYMETPATHTHTIKVAVLAPAPGVPYSIARVKADLRARLHLLPPFCRRVVEVPFGFHHPVWIESRVDLDWHVRQASAEPPGGSRELDTIVSMIASVPLDRSRPLWELWFVDGLAGGRVAAVGKIHHSVADGVAVAALLANVIDPIAGTLAPEGSTGGMAGGEAEAAPSRLRLLRDALLDHGRQIRRLPRLVGRTARNLTAVVRGRRDMSPRPPRPIVDVPRTSLNGALTPRRAFASTALSLDDVRTVKTAFGVTLNDVLLAVVAGSLRRYLAGRGELPERPLVAEVPVATDAPGARRLMGNRLSNIFTSLCTDLADPAARLRAIHQASLAAKRQHELLGPDLYESWTEYFPPRLFAWAVRLHSRWHLADHHRPPINVVVSCVPGPRARLGWPGGTLEAIYSVGPIIEGAALNVTAWSYVDRLCVGVLTCPDLVPSPHQISDGLRAALGELLVATREIPVAGRPSRAAR